MLGDAAKPLLAQIDHLACEARADALAGLGAEAREALAAGLQHVRASLDALLRAE